LPAIKAFKTFHNVLSNVIGEVTKKRSHNLRDIANTHQMSLAIAFLNFSLKMPLSHALVPFSTQSKHKTFCHVHVSKAQV